MRSEEEQATIAPTECSKISATLICAIIHMVNLEQTTWKARKGVAGAGRCQDQDFWEVDRDPSRGRGMSTHRSVFTGNDQHQGVVWEKNGEVGHSLVSVVKRVDKSTKMALHRIFIMIRGRWNMDITTAVITWCATCQPILSFLLKEITLTQHSWNRADIDDNTNSPGGGCNVVWYFLIGGEQNRFNKYIHHSQLKIKAAFDVQHKIGQQELNRLSKDLNSYRDAF